MTTRGFQCKFAVASGQDREPISLEQFPDEILFMHIVFNKQNYHRVHINLFNGLRASKEIFCDIAATSLKIRDLNFADCIVAPGLRGRNRSIPTESTCNGKENPEGLLRNVGLVCTLPKLEIPTNCFLLNSHRGQDHGRRQAIKRIPIKDLISEDGTRELTASLDMEPYIRSAMAVIHT